MLKNLTQHLNNQLDKLDKATPETIDTEVLRADAVVKVSKEVVSIADTVLRANELAYEYNLKPGDVLLLEDEG